MNSDKSPASAETSDMEFKLRRRVARKVMSDIHGQVREIEEQESSERRARRLLLPGLLVTALLLLLLWLQPDWLRSLSALF